MTLEELKTDIGKELCHPGQQLLHQGCRVLEAGLLKRGKPALQRSKQCQLGLLSYFGWIGQKRWQMRDAVNRFAFPLVQSQNLAPHHHSGPLITRQVVAMAAHPPYHQGGYLLSSFIEDTSSSATPFSGSRKQARGSWKKKTNCYLLA
ncbi:MAG: hypothetical protein MUP44_02670 [Anaerolineales bacterium]|nr:hypothetical protein [Anaerolineales bacterium]